MRLVAIAILGCMVFASPSVAQTESLFWVVGSRVKGCWIVQQNPVIDGSNIQFSDGPYRTEDDAKLAMTTISVCRT